MGPKVSAPSFLLRVYLLLLMEEKIAVALGATVSANLTQRNAAESFLKECRGKHGFSVVLLQLASALSNDSKAGNLYSV